LHGVSNDPKRWQTAVGDLVMPKEKYDVKKATRKLGVHRETLRMLAELDLVRAAAGGRDVQSLDTGGANNTCVTPDLAD
jgi:hypothetical protein